MPRLALTLASAVAAASIAASASADIRVQFDEGAPKDRFTITRTGGCDLSNARITVDLAGSRNGLIFDTTSSGAGFSVFQPFELVAGAQYLTGSPSVQDGDQQITLPVAALPSGESVAFTIDIDNTIGSSRTMVQDAEMAGVSVIIETQGMSAKGTFDARDHMLVRWNDCTS